MKKNLIYIVIAAAVLLVFSIPAVRSFFSSTFFPVATIEKAVTLSDVDYNIELQGINTADANLKDFKGRNPLFLNFWGTWCPPCRREWPSIQKLYDARKDKMGFVLIAMQDQEAEVRKFLAENRYSAPVYIAKSPIPEGLLPNVFPTTFVLSRDGRILIKEDGTKDWSAAETVRFIDNVSK